eukprot:c6111_g1_i1.p1 GENE.c6111_g1_i1~~c6111_g1_i1.p1  ORF type:complete len:230 (+),score=40.47 c6111_g1_i1:50-691(+)
METIRIVVTGTYSLNNFVYQYVHNFYDEGFDPYIEDSYRKQVTVDDLPCLLDILLLNEMEEYSATRTQFYYSHDAFIIGHSASSASSFTQSADIVEEILRIKESTPPLILIALINDDRSASTSAAESFARSLRVPFFAVCPKTKRNVDETFAELIREVRRSRSKCPIDRSRRFSRFNRFVLWCESIQTSLITKKLTNKSSIVHTLRSASTSAQ